LVQNEMCPTTFNVALDMKYADRSDGYPPICGSFPDQLAS